jgi:hypothetical protein
MALSGSLVFLSASVTGSENINIDFVGLNTIVVDPVSASSNILGHTQATSVTNYINSSVDAGFTDVAELNSLLTNRNGPYQHPSWRQYRGGDHPVARALRLNNTMSIDIAFPDAKKREYEKKLKRGQIEDTPVIYSINDPLKGPVAIEFFERENKVLEAYGKSDFWPTDRSLFAHSNLKQFYEPPVTTKHKPFVYSVDGVDGSTIKVRVPLMNQMADFSSEELNDKLRLSSGNPKTGSANNSFVFDKP